MMFFEYIGGTEIFREIEHGLNAIVGEPMFMILGALIIGAAIYALARRY